MSCCTQALKPARSDGGARWRRGALHRRRQVEEHVGAGDQVDAGRDHGGGVDQGADRRGAGHGVGQPGLQRQLGRLAHRARPAAAPPRRRPSRSRPATAPPPAAAISWMSSVPSCVKSRNRPTAIAASPTRVTMNALHGRAPVGAVRVPEADQQVAAQPDALPAEVSSSRLSASTRMSIEADEQVHVGEEAAVAVVVRHEAGRVEQDEEADERDHTASSSERASR